MAEGSHRLLRMSGRDPHERHRAATPLELLFDLTFVVAFGAAGNELAHGLAEGHVTSGLIGFGFAMFAICWAWINFSWFASAYDTDDWGFRLLTMVQMAGVLILALGLPEMFESVHTADHIDNRVMVAGYVVMRVAMVGQWLRAMREDPGRRDCARIYIASLVGARQPGSPWPWPTPRSTCSSSWCWFRCSSRPPARSSPRPGGAAPRGTRITSPSATGC